MTKFFLIAATMLTIAAAPVSARDANPAAASSATESMQQAPTATVGNPRQRYCVIEPVTGSRIPVKFCQTRQQWLDEGFDPLAKR